MSDASLFDLIRSDIELKQHWILKNDSCSLAIDDVPDYCTVIGVPARIFDRKTTWVEEKLAGKGDHW
jgi:hypothetical protein